MSKSQRLPINALPRDGGLLYRRPEALLEISDECAPTRERPYPDIILRVNELRKDKFGRTLPLRRSRSWSSSSSSPSSSSSLRTRSRSRSLRRTLAEMNRNSGKFCGSQSMRPTSYITDSKHGRSRQQSQERGRRRYRKRNPTETRHSFYSSDEDTANRGSKSMFPIRRPGTVKCYEDFHNNNNNNSRLAQSPSRLYHSFMSREPHYEDPDGDLDEADLIFKIYRNRRPLVGGETLTDNAHYNDDSERKNDDERSYGSSFSPSSSSTRYRRTSAKSSVKRKRGERCHTPIRGQRSLTPKVGKKRSLTPTVGGLLKLERVEEQLSKKMKLKVKDKPKRERRENSRREMRHRERARPASWFSGEEGSLEESRFEKEQLSSYYDENNYDENDTECDGQRVSSYQP